MCLRGGVVANNSAVIKSTWLRCGYNIRASVIYGSELGAIGSRSMFVLRLNIRRLEVLFSCGPLLLGCLACANAAIAAVIADACRRVVVVGDSGVIGVVNDRHIDVIYSTVVRETAMVPAPAEIANSDVTESIIHAAIEADVRSPITSVPVIAAVAPTPVAGRPKNPYTWRQHPGAGNPIIIIVAISPISGRPDIALPGAYWLFVDRQFGRSNPDRDAYADLRERGRRYCKHDRSKERRSDGMDHTHTSPLS